jgi:hypothetical protein
MGVSPSEALFGSKPRSVSEAILLNELQDELNRSDLAQLRREIEARIGKDQMYQKQQFDQRRAKARIYQQGELVLVRKTDYPATGESRKLLPKFKGPYRVVAALPNDRYAIQAISGGARKALMVVSVDHVKPWVTLQDEVSCP